MKTSRLHDHLLKKKTSELNESKQSLFRVATFLGELTLIDNEQEKQSLPLDENKIIEKVTERVMKSIQVPQNGLDGHTPTIKELRSIILPLIPKARDGKDADEDRIIAKLLSKIPIPRDGKDATLPDLKEFASNIIDQIDVSLLKGMRNYVWNLLVELWTGEGGPGLVFHDTSLSGSGVPGDPLKVVATSAGSTSFNETPSGSGVSFSLAHPPSPVNSLMLYRGGALQKSGVGGDYTLSGANITLNVSLASGEILLATYQY